MHLSELDECNLIGRGGLVGEGAVLIVLHRSNVVAKGHRGDDRLDPRALCTITTIPDQRLASERKGKGESRAIGQEQ